MYNCVRYCYIIHTFFLYLFQHSNNKTSHDYLQIQNSDDVVVGVTNSQLTGQRVYNLSRTPQSQVKQTLRIRYEDASKIPLLLETIKEEIRTDCAKLIPGRLRAHWSNFEDDHLQVVVDAHFSIKPTGGEYHDNRQKVLQAIYRAVKKTGVSFEKSKVS